MTKSCAVPNCKTGYKSIKQKCSVFKVPRNVEQFKKWQVAISGIELKQSQFVCEKHFEEQYILRKWIKRDCDGRIIAQVPYVHPKLAKSAVPTVFDSPTEMEQGVSKFQESQLQDKLVEHKVDSPQESIQCKVLPPKEIVGITSTVQNYAVVVVDSVPTMPTVSTVCDRNFDISNITINNRISKVATTSENDSITVPKSWAVTEYNEEGGQSVVFSRLVKMCRNSMQIPVLEKSIIVKTDKILHYYVHGRPVDPERCQLPPVLEDITLLLNTLERFKNMNVCNGLGAINVHHLSVDTAFKDYVERWHDNNCTMISKRKRCDSCIKKKKQIMQREARLKKTQTLKRIRRMSNPIDQKKLMTLQKKYVCERREKNKIKQCIQLITQSLKEKAD
ncbi:hypothetical protein DMN91_011996 [Ooceraea biroi]|uniref:THAP-type domain-containing protein n=1 Tax=Ooceraea biroi TaxID=2015173 RepID=A0A026VSU1_OOCBI|nr:uncharacterized protein LOC105287103 [Ooceraea biroi]EZA46797.1 hypothetical protein X777_01510 [Ooceraea biroi]RLU16236.1 hypothetical protein DMN91_011996 [Ooceraea biroi]